MDNILAKETATYEANKKKLLEEHEGKYVVIKGDKIYGVYNTENLATRAAYKEFGYVNLLVRKITEKDPVAFIKGVNIPWVTSR